MRLSIIQHNTMLKLTAGKLNQLINIDLELEGCFNYCKSYDHRGNKDQYLKIEYLLDFEERKILKNCSINIRCMNILH